VKRVLGRWVVAGAAISMALAAAGCGTKVTDGSSDAANTVVVWSSWAEGSSQQKVYKEAFAKFTEKTGIKVDARFQGGDVWNALKTAVPSGQGPDLMPADASRLGDYDFLADVTPILDAKTPEGVPVRDGIHPNILKATQDGSGTPKMIADELLGYGVWYDAAKHPEFEKTPPGTWTEFIAAAKASKAAGTPAISLDGTHARQTSRWFSWPLLRLAGPGSFRALGADKTGAAWDTPETLKAAQMTASLVSDGLFQPGFEGSKSPAAQNAWAQNKMTFLLQGSWVQDETGPQQAAGFTAKQFPFPTVDGGKGNSLVVVGLIGWSVSTKARNAAGAQQLVAYLQGKETMSQIGAVAHNIPAQSTVAPPADLADFRTAIEKAKELTITDDNAPTMGQWWDKVMTPLVADLMNAKLTPEQFVARGKSDTVKFWENA